MATLKIFCFLIIWKFADSFFFVKKTPKITEITPKDRFVFIGESLLLECHLLNNTAGLTSADLSFKIKSNTRNLKWTVPNVSVVDNSTINATIEITEDFSKINTVYCSAGSADPASTYINVEHPVQNITNFTAICYYNRQTEFSWSLAQTYFNPELLIKTVDWNPYSPPNQVYNICSMYSNTSCTIDKMFGQDIIFVRINISINDINLNKRPPSQYLSTEYPTCAVSIIELSMNDCRKTMPPIDLRVVDINSTSVTLTWDHPLYFTSCECHVIYEITLTNKYNKSIVIIDNGIRQYLQGNVTVYSLVPYTTYIISARIKADQINPWSEPSVTETKTNEDRPLSGPPLTDTSFSGDECDLDNRREVTVYWNDPLTDSLQGELTEFEVAIDQKRILLRKGSNFFKIKLNCDTNYSVNVYSATKAGNTMNPSFIEIPNKNDELPLLTNVTVKLEKINNSLEEKLGNVILNCDHGQMNDNITLIFYMCQEANFPKTCFNDFTTKEIKVPAAESVLTGIPSAINLFGYALKDENGPKRGIQWINCVYYADELPGQIRFVNVVNLENALLVSWISTKCDKANKILIRQYHLFVCSNQEEDPQKIDQTCTKINISNSENTFVVKDLQGGHSYYVCIQAESPAGLGPKSKYVIGTPLHNQTNEVYIVISTVLVGCIILGCLLVCCIRRCKQSHKKVMHYSVHNQIMCKDEFNKQLQDSKNTSTDISKCLSTSNGEKTVESVCSLSQSQDNMICSETNSEVADVEQITSEISQDKHDVNTDNLNVENLITSPIDASDGQNALEEQNVSEERISQSPANAAEEMNLNQSPSLLTTENSCMFSDDINQYVKITNTNIVTNSDSSSKNAPDRRFNSPHTEINSQMCVTNNSQPFHTNVKSESPSASSHSTNLDTEISLLAAPPTQQNIIDEPFVLSQLPNVDIINRVSILPSFNSPSVHVFNVDSNSGDFFTNFATSCALDENKLTNKTNNCLYFDNENNQLNTEASKSISNTNWSTEIPLLSTENIDNQSDGYIKQVPCEQTFPIYLKCTVDGEIDFSQTNTNTNFDCNSSTETSLLPVEITEWQPCTINMIEAATEISGSTVLSKNIHNDFCESNQQDVTKHMSPIYLTCTDNGQINFNTPAKRENEEDLMASFLNLQLSPSKDGTMIQLNTPTSEDLSNSDQCDLDQCSGRGYKSLDFISGKET